MKETVNWDRVVRWPTLTFKSTCYSIYGIWPWPSDNSIALPVHSPQVSWSALTFMCPNMEVLGGCPAQIFSNSTDSLQTHGNSWKFPSTLTTAAGGREYYSHGLEYFSVPNVVNKWVFSTRGYCECNLIMTNI